MINPLGRSWRNLDGDFLAQQLLEWNRRLQFGEPINSKWNNSESASRHAQVGRERFVLSERREELKGAGQFVVARHIDYS